MMIFKTYSDCFVIFVEDIYFPVSLCLLCLSSSSHLSNSENEDVIVNW